MVLAFKLLAKCWLPNTFFILTASMLLIWYVDYKRLTVGQISILLQMRKDQNELSLKVFSVKKNYCNFV